MIVICIVYSDCISEDPILAIIAKLTHVLGVIRQHTSFASVAAEKVHLNGFSLL